MWHVWGRGDACASFWWGNLRESTTGGGDPGADGRIILRWILKWDVGGWTGSSWLRIETGDGHL